MEMKVQIIRGQGVSVEEGLTGHFYEEILLADTKEEFLKRLRYKARGYTETDTFIFQDGSQVIGWNIAEQRIMSIL